MTATTKVLGVLAGRDLAPGALEAWLGWADRIVAADGGADLCRAAGKEPDAIVGDLDSIADATGLTPDPDQDTSDADKLLARLAREGHRSVTLIGVEGDRLDHVLATLGSCARSTIPDLRLILRTGVGLVGRAGTSGRWTCAGRVSLIPLGPCRATLRGVRWPLENALLDPLGLVSISNRVDPPSGGTVELTIHEGAAVLFLEASGKPES